MSRMSILVIGAVPLLACAASAPTPVAEVPEPAARPVPAAAPAPVAPPPVAEPAPVPQPVDAPAAVVPEPSAPSPVEEPIEIAQAPSRTIRAPGSVLVQSRAQRSSTAWVFQVNGRALDFPNPTVGAEPGSTLNIALREAESAPSVGASVSGPTLRFERLHDYTWEASAGSLLATGGLNAARWVLPGESGVHTLTIDGETEIETSVPGARGEEHVVTAAGETLRVQVLSPFNRDGPGVVDGYPIGVYPNENGRAAPGPVANRPDAYRPPSHFWRVDASSRDARLSRHVRLGDLCSVPPVDGVAQTAVDPDLVDRIEALTAMCAANGWLGPEDDLTILRGYLSPSRVEQLRQAGLRLSPFTRHLYGDAAIVIVDRDGDRRMDDLTGDGLIDRADAEALAAEVETLEARMGRGGLGIFATAPEGDPELPDTPMVQFDCRGVRARW